MPAGGASVPWYIRTGIGRPGGSAAGAVPADWGGGASETSCAGSALADPPLPGMCPPSAVQMVAMATTVTAVRAVSDRTRAGMPRR